MTESPPRPPFGSGQFSSLGGVAEESAPAEARLRVPYRPDLASVEGGPLACGVVVTLLDSACGRAVHRAIPEGTTIATLDLRVDHMRDARPGRDVTALCECYKVTPKIAFVRGLAHDGDPSDPVATAQGAFMVDAHAGRAPGANLKAGS